MSFRHYCTSCSSFIFYSCVMFRALSLHFNVHKKSVLQEEKSVQSQIHRNSRQLPSRSHRTIDVSLSTFRYIKRLNPSGHMRTQRIYVFLTVFPVKPIISLSIIGFVCLRDTERGINFMLQVDITLIIWVQYSPL